MLSYQDDQDFEHFVNFKQKWEIRGIELNSLSIRDIIQTTACMVTVVNNLLGKVGVRRKTLCCSALRSFHNVPSAMGPWRSCNIHLLQTWDKKGSILTGMRSRPKFFFTKLIVYSIQANSAMRYSFKSYFSDLRLRGWMTCCSCPLLHCYCFLHFTVSTEVP